MYRVQYNVSDAHSFLPLSAVLCSVYMKTRYQGVGDHLLLLTALVPPHDRPVDCFQLQTIYTVGVYISR